MSLLFATKQMEEDFYLKLHPETRLVVVELDQKMVRPMTITHVCRTNEDSERIYLEVIARLSKGGKLSTVDLAQWEQLKDLSPVGRKMWAQRRASWHKAWTSVDVGLAGWGPRELAVMTEYIHTRCPRPAWEVITELHGTGPHLHLARRDYEWLKAFPGGLRDAQGRAP